MSLFERLKSWVAPQSAPQAEEKAFHVEEKGLSGSPLDPFNAGFMTASGFGSSNARTADWLVEYEKNCHLRAPFERLAVDTSLVPLQLWRRLPKGQCERVYEHPILELLADPAPGMTQMVWRQTIQLQKDISGEWFLWIEFDERGQVRYLHNLPKPWITSTPRVGAVHYTVMVPGYGSEILWPEEVIWHRSARPANPYGRGIGVASSLDDEVSQLTWMAKYNNSFFRNGTMVGSVLAVENAAPNSLERMRAEWENRHQGAGNAFRTAVINGKITHSNLSQAHKDLDFNQGIKNGRAVVRETLGTPGEIHGHTDTSNKATSEVADHLHQLYGQYPRCVDFEQALNKYLVPLYGDKTLFLKHENPVKETAATKIDRVDRAVARGVMTVNQSNVELGLEKTPDGDVYLVPMNVVPIRAGGLLDAAKQAQETAAAGIRGADQPPAPAPAKNMPGKSLDQYLGGLTNGATS